MPATQEITLKELAESMNAKLSDPSAGDKRISGFTTLEEAESGDLSFVTASRYKKEASKSRAAAILVPGDMELENTICLRVDNVWKAVLTALEIFYSRPEPTGEIDATARIHKKAEIGENVTVGPYSVIEEGVKIGDDTVIGALCYIGRNTVMGNNCLLHPRVTILDETQIGHRVIIHPGAVLASDGFKYEVIEGIPTKIPQVGKVIVEDDAEIGANTCIDRASLTETRIGKGVKIDNLVQIAHNVRIGEHTMMAGQVGIAGSTIIGKRCLFGGNVGIRDNITLGDDVIVLAMSGISKSFPSGETLFGIPAMKVKDSLKREATLRKLTRYYQTIEDLEKRISELEEKLPDKS